LQHVNLTLHVPYCLLGPILHFRHTFQDDLQTTDLIKVVHPERYRTGTDGLRDTHSETRRRSQPADTHSDRNTGNYDR
jgi:hypothetical protein